MQQHITNKVILIGSLQNAGRRDHKEAAQTRRTETGATVEAFSLEILSPYNEPIIVPLEGSKQIPGAELITKANIGKPIAVEGVIRRRVVTDRRLSVTDADTGVRRAETVVAITLIREPHADEPHNRSLAVLEGTISTEARFGAHRSVLANQMARTILQVAYTRQAGWGATTFGVNEMMEVAISIPLSAEAYALYVPGNIVRVMGELDLAMIPQTRNQAATAKLEQIDAEWPETKAKIATAVPNEQERERQLRAATRRYRNQRAALEQIASLSVVVGSVELLSGSEATPEQVAEMQKEQRRNRRAVRRMNPRTAARAQAEVLVSAVAQVEIPAATADALPAEVGETNAPVTTLKPRRVVRRDEQTEPVLNGADEVKAM